MENADGVPPAARADHPAGPAAGHCAGRGAGARAAGRRAGLRSDSGRHAVRTGQGEDRSRRGVRLHLHPLRALRAHPRRVEEDPAPRRPADAGARRLRGLLDSLCPRLLRRAAAGRADAYAPGRVRRPAQDRRPAHPERRARGDRRLLRQPGRGPRPVHGGPARTAGRCAAGPGPRLGGRRRRGRYADDHRQRQVPRHRRAHLRRNAEDRRAAGGPRARPQVTIPTWRPSRTPCRMSQSRPGRRPSSLDPLEHAR